MYALEPGEREKHGRRRRREKEECGEWVLIWKHCKRLIRMYFFYPAEMSLSSVNNGFIIQMD